MIAKSMATALLAALILTGSVAGQTASELLQDAPCA
jgi:hypothetical protein